MGRRYKRVFVPNDPHAMRVCKGLAMEIGFNESIVLLQLEFLIGISNHKIDGREWTYQSTRTLREEHFPWWSITTIHRAIKSLEEKELLTVANYNKQKYDKTRWFALNLEECDKLASMKVDWATLTTPETLQYETGLFQNETRSVQNETTIPETTTETTTEDISNQSQTQTPSPEQQDSSLAEFECLFGPVKVPERVHHTPKEIMASTKRASARGWANRAASGKTTHRAFEKALAKYGDDAPALRELHEQIETNFGLAPNWSSVSKVKEWTNGLSELYAAARGDISIAIAAAKKLRSDSMTMATPHSIVITAQSIAAERATAHTAPSARAVKEYR